MATDALRKKAYYAYYDMVRRCYDEEHPAYEDYARYVMKVNPNALYTRLSQHGWSLERTISEPVRPRKSKVAK